MAEFIAAEQLTLHCFCAGCCRGRRNQPASCPAEIVSDPLFGARRQFDVETLARRLPTVGMRCAGRMKDEPPPAKFRHAVACLFFASPANQEAEKRSLMD